MGNFFNGFGFNNLLSGLGGLASGFTSLYTSKKARKSAEKMNRENIAFQREANQQNIDFQEKWNTINRRDAMNADSIRKNSLAAAGYSTADPFQSGASAIISEAPNVEAPQVQQEFTDQNAAALASGINEALMMPSQVNLIKAQAETQRQDAKGKEIDNAWKPVLNQSFVDQAKAKIALDGANMRLSEKQIEVAQKQMDKIQQDIEASIAITDGVKFENSKKQERYEREVKRYWLDCLALIQEIEESKTRASLNRVRRRYENITANLLEKGININKGPLDNLVSYVGQNGAKGLGRDLVEGAGNLVRGVAQGFWNTGIDFLTRGNSNNPLSALKFK